MNAPASLQPFAPHWSAEQLAAAVPHALPPLHRFDFAPPANAAELHRPRRRTAPYVAQAALAAFRIRG
ncbi:MAG: hypothetical protein ACOY82_05520 [Pseudomonadota bacterium]